MLDHVSITVADIAVAEPFYDAIMTVLGVIKVGARSDWLGYGERPAGTPGAGLSVDPQGRRRNRPMAGTGASRPAPAR